MWRITTESIIRLQFLEDLLTKTTLKQLADDVEDYQKQFKNPDGSCLVSEPAALLAVAKSKYQLSLEEYSPHSDLVEPQVKALHVRELTGDMNQQFVAVKGEVVAIYDTKTFRRKRDGKQGCYTSIKFQDLESEAFTFVKFWGKRTHDLEKHFSVGDKLLLENFKVDVYQNYPNLNHQGRNSKITFYNEKKEVTR